MPTASLSPELVEQVLAYLGCPRKSPSIRYLDRLVQAYIQRVPWESASRIIKRHTTRAAADCPRWPEEFWSDALSLGTGGTCFECNLAFYSLLGAFGFQGYLTINDMSEKRACHTACVISLADQKYLVDVAIPLPCALPFQAGRVTKRAAQFHHYTIRPSGADRFEIERSHHPKRNVYTLLDAPVPMQAYQAAVEKDYRPGGTFLDRVILVKVVGNRIWRFNSLERPYKLEGFDKTSREEIRVPPAQLAPALSRKFGMREEKIAAALAFLQVAEEQGQSLRAGDQ